MCQSTRPPMALRATALFVDQPAAAVPPTAAPAEPAAAASARPAAGTRRRRLWDLGAHTHCPVLGVCLPLPALRRLATRSLGGRPPADDYELHVGLVAECRQRGRMAEALQRELDRRHAAALRASATAKTPDALAAWWRQASADAGPEDALAGALWATLTHARCSPALEQQVLGEVHMLQHQVGMAGRADLARLEALQDENALLARELARAQQRATQATRSLAQRVEALQAQLQRAQAEQMARDTTIAALRDELAQLHAAVPALRCRRELAAEVTAQAARAQALEREALALRHEAERQRHRAQVAEAALASRRAVGAPPAAPAGAATAPAAPGRDDPAAELRDRAVLCVGGRAGSVPRYRALVEAAGARFLHHDGGEEDPVARLDATLSAADLVICQTGCVSHDAYWRVKDHCRRTGKRCAFVERPSRAGLARALQALACAGQPADASGDRAADAAAQQEGAR